jgi:integral membrane protein (TIGR01906 family)
MPPQDSTRRESQRVYLSSRTRTPAPLRLVLGVLSLLGAVFLPLAVITTVVLQLMFNASYYEVGQARYDVYAVTGLTVAQTDRVDDGIVRFFGSSESLPAALQASGAPPNVFQEKEILHMVDVRTIVQTFGKLQAASILIVAAFIALALSTWRAGGRRALARCLMLSAGLTLLLGAVAGGLTYFAFDWLFLTFHEVTFHNDYWQLDPRTDHLIQLFPYGFWFDAMLTVAMRVVLVMALVGVAGWWLSRSAGRWDRR